MYTTDIIKLSQKNIDYENLEKAKNFLEKEYEISYGEYDSHELKKAIDGKSPVIIRDNLIIGYEPDGRFVTMDDKKINIERMVKAIVVEQVSANPDSYVMREDADFFAIISRNEWDHSISEFVDIFGNLRVGELFLPNHSVVFNFMKPSDEEIKKKIVSMVHGVNVNIYSHDNYVENAMHEVGHIFWRDCVKMDEKEKFERHCKFLKPAAIYEYQWERENAEEVFCTIYKWYLKSLLLNKAFYNILEYEEPEGLRLIQNIFERVAKDRMTQDIWDREKHKVLEYLNPKIDRTTGKKIVKKGLLDDIKDLELPDSVMNDINRYEGGKDYINLGKAVVPVKNNKIVYNVEKKYVAMEKAGAGYRKKKEKPLIYMDMDGVIADFARGYQDAFFRDAYQDDSFTIRQHCLQVPRFFRMLPVSDKGFDLFKNLKDDYRIVFLTTPMEGMEYCKRDKIDWIRDNIGEYDVIFSDDKAEYVEDENSFLIDDMSYNLEPWCEAGGTAINFRKRNDMIIDIIDRKINDREEMESIAEQLKNMVVNTNPTEKQKESGVYKKGEIDFKGLKIKIENPKGSIRWGFGQDGKKFMNRMKCHYGYIVNGQDGADGDKIDVFIGPHLNKSLAFVVNQGTGDGRFDESKVMLGFESVEDAETAYYSNYQRGWDRLDSIKQTNTKKLREWLERGNTNDPF